MKMRKRLEPAHREYYVAFIRNNGERVEDYFGYVWRSETKAQAFADERNAHYKHGRCVVAFKDRPASIVWVGRLAL